MDLVFIILWPFLQITNVDGLSLILKVLNNSEKRGGVLIWKEKKAAYSSKWDISWVIRKNLKRLKILCPSSTLKNPHSQTLSSCIIEEKQVGKLTRQITLYIIWAQLKNMWGFAITCKRHSTGWNNTIYLFGLLFVTATKTCDVIHVVTTGINHIDIRYCIYI